MSSRSCSHQQRLYERVLGLRLRPLILSPVSSGLAPPTFGSTGFPRPTGSPLVSNHFTSATDLRAVRCAPSLDPYSCSRFLLPFSFAFVLGPNILAPPSSALSWAVGTVWLCFCASGLFPQLPPGDHHPLTTIPSPSPRPPPKSPPSFPLLIYCYGTRSSLARGGRSVTLMFSLFSWHGLSLHLLVSVSLFIFPPLLSHVCISCVYH